MINYNILRTLYTKINSCVLVNGWLSESFQVQRGIRQGCPLSALLFILATEMLSINIKQDQRVKGIKVGNDLEVKIVQMADDTTVMVEDEISVANVFNTIDKFSDVSGITVNIDKTEGLWLGPNQPILDHKVMIKWSNEPVKSLGIHFGKDKKLVEDLNWKPKLEKLEKTLNRWKARKLTYYGRISIIKTIGISQILYNASCINVPDYVIKEVNRTLYKFLWGSSKEKVKRRTTTQYMGNGGLQMTDIKCQIDALRIKWITRMLDTNNTGMWNKIVKYLLEPIGGLSMLLELNCKSKDVNKLFYNKNLPSFYKDVLKAWYVLQEKKDDDYGVHKNDILWGNNNVRYKGQMLYYTKWINAGIICVHDIVTKDRFINLTELSRKIKCPTNIFKLHTLVSAIPKKWKKEEKMNNLCSQEKQSCTLFNVKNKVKHISVLQTKDIYITC